MNKSEWIWTAIRISGIFLVVMAIVAIPELISSTYNAVAFGNQAETSSGDPLMMQFNALAKAHSTMAVNACARIVLFSGFGFYFLKHGKLLHRLATHES
ncbi:MAG: hypothetical protein EP312_09200 [Gammaproteobacteria bacterium]|nr:MAG: hypothetical protein EP312_09200 [Gammaproteobacteria bacterium]